MIEVRLGLRNSLQVDAVQYPIVRERNGWHRIDGLPGGRLRVRYEWFHDRFRIECGDAPLSVHFRLRPSGFEWRGRWYRIRPMILFKPLGRGAVLITREDSRLVTGRLTFTGVRLDLVAPELEPVSAGLALGLALRGQAYLQATSGGGGDYGTITFPP